MPAAAPLLDVTIASDLAGERLDRAIAQLCPTVSRLEARRMIGGGSVFVDDHRTRICSKLLHVGQHLVCYRLAGSEPTNAPAVLLAHDDFLVLDKPAGMAVAATRSGDAGTVERWLLKEGHPAFMTHRLDAPVSGALVAARNPVAQAAFNKLFVAHAVDRRYLAGVAPAPSWDEKIIDALLDGQPARTRVKVVSRSVQAALLDVRLESGRFRQIRRHLAGEGSPVIGDRDQPNARPAERILLHACQVSFTWNDQLIVVDSPLPPAFIRALEAVFLTVGDPG